MSKHQEKIEELAEKYTHGYGINSNVDQNMFMKKKALEEAINYGITIGREQRQGEIDFLRHEAYGEALNPTGEEHGNS